MTCASFLCNRFINDYAIDGEHCPFLTPLAYMAVSKIKSLIYYAYNLILHISYKNSVVKMFFRMHQNEGDIRPADNPLAEKVQEM